MQITVHTPTVLVVSNLRTPLNQEKINSELLHSYWRVSVVDVTGSTQNDLANSVRASNSQHGDVLVSEYQSSGRGRLDRTFEAPPLSALLFSFFIEPQIDAADLSWIPLIAGLSVVGAIDSCCNITLNKRVMLKWPNDILIGEKKIAGLISEHVDKRGVVVGIGINVGMNESELPVDHASSLEIEGCHGCDRDALLVAILTEFTSLLNRLERGDKALRDEYAARCATINSAVRVEHPAGDFTESVAIAIDASGALVLADGKHVNVGDVIHLQRR